MAKKMLIDATHTEETRVVVVDGNKVEEFDFESAQRRQLAGNIYLAKVTRVEPSLQAAFVDYGGNRHGFLAFSEIHPDYYQIPVADREALLAEERALAQSQSDEDEAEDEEKPAGGALRPANGRRSRSRSRPRAAANNGDAVAVQEVESSNDAPGEIAGMEMIDLESDDAAPEEGLSPMVRAAETPVDTPAADDLQPEVDEGEDRGNLDVIEKDDTIETVATEDDSDDMRPMRKPRAKRYKIQEVVKVRQIMLVQVVKEERGSKGAALTTYLSLAGRYCVLMPNTARGGGISRKITNILDRKKLKEIANEIDVPDGAGLIIRTAGSQRTKSEIKRDYEYLQRLWEQIRELTLKSIAPAKIYEEGDLIKRSIRDLYSKDIDEVIVEGIDGYRIAKDFMKMIMPSHAKNVKPYAENLPLFARHQVEGYLAAMFNPTVQLPSGGYIVIGITEALVAIDVNSGRATKEGSIEQTALKTNLEAADEVARQLRLRDLAGLIVIDFIDMDERKNNAAVEKRFKDKLKTDRARIQVGRISGFGLMEMSRQRLRPGMLEATTQPCPHCHGTGLLRSDDNVALAILRQLEEEGVRGRSKEALVKAPVGIMNFLINNKREHIAAIELRYDMAVRVEADLSLISPDFTIEKFKTATRAVPVASAHVISANAALMAEEEDEDIVEVEEDEDEVEAEAPVAAPARAERAPAAETAEGDGQPRKKRRRRRRRRGGNGADGMAVDGQQNGDDTDDEGDEDEAATDAVAVAEPVEPAPAARTRSRSRSRKPAEPAVAAGSDAEAALPVEEAAAETVEAAPEAAKPKPRSRSRAKPAPAPAVEEAVADVSAESVNLEPVNPEPVNPEPVAEAAPAKPARSRRKPKPEAETAPVAPALAADAPAEADAPAVPDTTTWPADPQDELVAAAAEPAESKVLWSSSPDPDPAAEADKPKRRGWWSLGR